MWCECTRCERMWNARGTHVERTWNARGVNARGVNARGTHVAAQPPLSQAICLPIVWAVITARTVCTSCKASPQARVTGRTARPYCRVKPGTFNTIDSVFRIKPAVHGRIQEERCGGEVTPGAGSVQWWGHWKLFCSGWGAGLLDPLPAWCLAQVEMLAFLIISLWLEIGAKQMGSSGNWSRGGGLVPGQPCTPCFPDTPFHSAHPS